MTRDEIKAALAPLVVEVIEIETRPLPSLEDEERLDAIALEVGTMYNEEWRRAHGGRWGSQLSEALATIKARMGFSDAENHLVDWARARNYRRSTEAAGARA